MSAKALIFWGMVIGSIVGGYVPTLWGVGLLSYSSILTSGVGALIGIWLGYKLSGEG